MVNKLKIYIICFIIGILLYYIVNTLCNYNSGFNIGILTKDVGEYCNINRDGTHNCNPGLACIKGKCEEGTVEVLPEWATERNLLDGDFGELQKSESWSQQKARNTPERLLHTRYFRIEDDIIRIYMDQDYAQEANSSNIKISDITELQLEGIRRTGEWFYFKFHYGLRNKWYYIWSKKPTEIHRMYESIYEKFYGIGGAGELLSRGESCTINENGTHNCDVSLACIKGKCEKTQVIGQPVSNPPDDAEWALIEGKYGLFTKTAGITTTDAKISDQEELYFEIRDEIIYLYKDSDYQNPSSEIHIRYIIKMQVGGPSEFVWGLGHQRAPGGIRYNGKLFYFKILDKTSNEWIYIWSEEPGRIHRMYTDIYDLRMEIAGRQVGQPVSPDAEGISSLTSTALPSSKGSDALSARFDNLLSDSLLKESEFKAATEGNFEREVLEGLSSKFPDDIAFAWQVRHYIRSQEPSDPPPDYDPGIDEPIQMGLFGWGGHGDESQDEDEEEDDPV